jgi:ribosomal protein S18 acetylase RimI-like enzyme
MTAIRRATVDDAGALAVLAERVFRETFAADNNPADLESYIASAFGEEHQRRELADPRNPTFVVQQDGEMIAYAMLKQGEGELEIARFYVDHAHHGRGLAQRLMHDVLEFARACGVERVWLGVWERNLRAIAFYEKSGFRISGSHPFLLGSDLQTDYVMERRISVVPPQANLGR